MPGKMNKWVPLSVVFFLIGVAGLVALSIAYFYTTDEDFSYAIMFDAGSTKTKMYVYRWQSTKVNNTGVVEQVASCSVKGAAISDYVNNSAEVGQPLKTCLDQAKTIVPATLISATPVYLGATAGMRVLSQTNANASRSILTAIRNTMASSGFKLSDPVEQIRIITGQEEGVGGWVTVNYAFGKLGNFVKGSLMQLSSSTGMTTGTLDLGGASTQITFVDQYPYETPRNYSKDVVLYGYNYRLYSYSFLCYGLNEAIGSYRARLAAAQPSSAPTVLDPCLPLGYVNNITGVSLFSSFCTQSLRPQNAKSVYTFQGTSNSSQCAVNIRSLFDFRTCSFWNCSFNGAFMPLVGLGEFTAFAGYYYVTGNLGLINSNKSAGTFTQKEFLNETSKHCAKPWSQVNASDPNLCARANYVYTLLTDGYKFDERAWESILFANAANGMDFGWALGYMLNQTNIISVNKALPVWSAGEVTYVLLMVLFGLFCALAAGFTYMACHNRRRHHYLDT